MESTPDRAGLAPQLSDTKRALLEKRLNRLAGSAAAEPNRLRARPASAPRLASPGQARIWVMHQADPMSAAYNITSSFWVESGLDLNALQRSVDRVVARHEALRSSYRLDGAEIAQVVREHLSLAIEEAACASREDAFAAAALFARAPFDIEEGPLVRLRFFRAPSGEGVLTLVAHDIVFDKWSLKLFWSEAAAFYGEDTGGKPAGLEPLELQYSDFAYWQQSWLDAGEAKRQLAVWTSRLKDPPPPLSLPIDRAYPKRLTDAGALARDSLSAKLTSELKTLAAREDLSLFTALLYGYMAMLSYEADALDILVSSPVANRRKKETAQMIGFFLNTVVLRGQLEAEQSLLDGLKQVRERALEALDCQDLPLDAVVEAVRPTREPGRHPLSQVMFVYQREDEGRPQLKLDSCSIAPIYVETGTAKYDLTLFVAESGDQLELIFEYRTDIFDASTIARLLDRYRLVLQSLVARPTQKLRELSPLSPEERRLVEFEWQGPPLTPSRLEPVPSILETVGHARPAAIAVRMGEQSLAWSELLRQSESVARSLVARGVKRGELVGMCLPRSPRAVAALIGIWRAGGAYLPIDPEYPADRRRLLAEDSRIRYLVAHLNSDVSAWPPGVEALTLDDLKGGGSAALPPLDLDALAYVIYTSGSTGRPKGVMATHRNLLCSNEARFRRYPQSPGTFLLLSSLAFDSSLAGLFWTLASGGELVIPSEGEQRDPVLLRRLIRHNFVDTILCVPSFYDALLGGGAAEELASLRTVIVAGEALAPALVGRHFAALPGCSLFNEYGPTEATVWCAARECDAQDAALPSVPIGMPIAGARIRIVDSIGRTCVIGRAGEIRVAGSGVTLGYLGRPELTAERFVGAEDGARYYRTGDIGRWLPSGAIEFLGRNDEQVKVRGYRIELGEIEAALASLPGVSKAVVVATPDAAALPTLEALLSMASESTLEAALSEIERIPLAEQPVPLPPPAGAREVVREKFSLRLEERRAGFVDTPRKAQRDWLVAQAIEELADDLEHLDALAPRFVKGKEHHLGRDLKDIATAALSKDEIMEDWQAPLMRAMAECVAASHGDVLEIGFGRGVASEFLQSLGVRSHTVVEMNDHSVETYFRPFRARRPESDIRLIHARWQDAEPQLGMYDGIFFHAFPMNEAEFVEYVLNSVTFAEHAFPAMASHLKPGGVFTYLTTEIDSLSRRHQRALREHFSEIATRVIPLNVPQDTIDTWWAPSMVAIKAIK